MQNSSLDGNGLTVSGFMSDIHALLTSPRLALRALRLLGAALGIGLVLASGLAYAGDDDDDDEDDGRQFEHRMIDKLMRGLGGSKMGDSDINYRERSPLVVPSKIELPPPASRSAKPAPNWPKDPDEAARKAAIEEAKKPAMTPEQARMPLMPSELAQKGPRSTVRKDDTPGNGNYPSILSPSQLGYTGGLFSTLFKSNEGETAEFKGEPEREDLTQPPKGYQTPSPNFAYGVGPEKAKQLVCDSASGQCEKR